MEENYEEMMNPGDIREYIEEDVAEDEVKKTMKRGKVEVTLLSIYIVLFWLPTCCVFMW